MSRTKLTLAAITAKCTHSFSQMLERLIMQDGMSKSCDYDSVKQTHDLVKVASTLGYSIDTLIIYSVLLFVMRQQRI